MPPTPMRSCQGLGHPQPQVDKLWPLLADGLSGLWALLQPPGLSLERLGRKLLPCWELSSRDHRRRMASQGPIWEAHAEGSEGSTSLSWDAMGAWAQRKFLSMPSSKEPYRGCRVR